MTALEGKVGCGPHHRVTLTIVVEFSDGVNGGEEMESALGPSTWVGLLSLFSTACHAGHDVSKGDRGERRAAETKMKSVTVVNTPQCRCRAAVARCEITPPIGMYHRMWGAALHDRATGVHRPLEATLLWIEPHPPATGEPRVIVSLDHCILDAEEVHAIRDAIHASTTIGQE